MHTRENQGKKYKVWAKSGVSIDTLSKFGWKLGPDLDFETLPNLVVEVAPKFGQAQQILKVQMWFKIKPNFNLSQFWPKLYDFYLGNRHYAAMVYKVAFIVCACVVNPYY